MGDEKQYPEVEVVRDDQAALWRQGMKALREEVEAARPGQLEERARKRQAEQYGIREQLWFRVVELVAREGEPSRYRATCIAGLPKEDLSVHAEAPTPEDAVHEARFGYAEALFKGQCEKTWEAAKARASKAELNIADVVPLHG